jgi:uncharacterized membrane protein HdeD (DUF308 family)
VNNEPIRPGEGWVAFAGIVLALAGILNFIWGIAAIDDSAFFTDEGRYILFDDLNTWGWFFLIVGVLQMAAAFSIWNGHAFGQLFGIFSASMNIIVLLFTVNAYPFAAFMLFIIDLLVIYALVAYGGQRLGVEQDVGRVEPDARRAQSGRDTLQPPTG